MKDAEECEISVRRKLLESYIITNNADDYILCEKLHDAITDDKKKIWNELESMGVIKKASNHRGNTRGKICYFGIKEIPPEEGSEEDTKTEVCY